MLIGTIRPTETRTANVEGPTLAVIAEQLRAQTPAGFELASAPVRMLHGNVTATGTYIRVDGLREIDADDRAALEAKVPDGYQLLNVRAV